MISLHNIVKSYHNGKMKMQVVKNINFQLGKGQFIAVMGPSGSGKTTLLNLIGLLDRPDSGTYYFSEQDVSKLNDNELAKLRNNKIGFIFQNYNLIYTKTVLENITLPLNYSKVAVKQAKAKGEYLSELLGFQDHIHKFPDELSGGQQQRVAIARALINEPDLILADEPTGNLDSENGFKVMELLKNLHEKGQSILLVTHDLNVAKFAERVEYMNDGKLVNLKSLGEDVV